MRNAGPKERDPNIADFGYRKPKGAPSCIARFLFCFLGLDRAHFPSLGNFQ
jgi:hypothetical protein